MTRYPEDRDDHRGGEDRRDDHRSGGRGDDRRGDDRRGDDRRGGGYERRDRDRFNPHARVYIGNVPDDITRDELNDFVGKYGQVVDIDVKHKASNGTAYAFVTFEDERDADDCIRGRDGARFMDGNNSLRVRVEKAGRDRRRAERGPPRRSDFRVYVTGLPRNASWQDLKDMFRSVADVGYANVERDVGVVEFHDRRDCEEAIKAMDGKDFTNNYGTDRISVSDRPPEGHYGGGNSGGGYRGGGGDDRRGRDRSMSPRRRSPSPRRRSRSKSVEGGRDRRRSPVCDRRRESPPPSKRDEDSAGRGRSRSPPRSNSRD